MKGDGASSSGFLSNLQMTEDDLQHGATPLQPLTRVAKKATTKCNYSSRHPSLKQRNGKGIKTDGDIPSLNDADDDVFTLPTEDAL